MSAAHRESEIAAAKAEVRERVRALRCSLDPATCALHAEAVAENLLSLPELQGAHVVLAYSAIAEEIDPAIAVDALRAMGKVIALPRIEAPGVLGVHIVEHGAELEPGSLGILQPHAGTPRVELRLIDAVIVPGVAFDEQGRRLGYGGGFFDRLLPRLRPDCARIGLAYDEQLVPELPIAEHDEHVHLVVSPTRVLRTREAGPGRH